MLETQFSGKSCFINLIYFAHGIKPNKQIVIWYNLEALNTIIEQLFQCFCNDSIKKIGTEEEDRGKCFACSDDCPRIVRFSISSAFIVTAGLPRAFPLSVATQERRNC